jgi:recombination protein RecT
MTGTVATRGPADMVRQHREDFAQVLPTHIKPETFVRVAVGVVNRDENLRAAATRDPGSLMVALLDAARQGLEPGTEQYYLTVRSGKVLGVRGYQGEIELIYRAGAVSSVIAEVVYRGDKFAYQPGRDERPRHEVDWDADDRGPIRLAYAYAIMKDGATSKVVIVNKARIDRAKQASATAGKSFSPWNSDEAAMWLKTAIHDLRKWVPTSAEYLRSRQESSQAESSTPAPAIWQPQGDTPLVDATTGEVLDAELVEDPPDADWPETAPIPGTDQ